MIVREHMTFAALDWALGQDATAAATTAPATAVAPAPPPAPAPVPAPPPVSIPIIQLGPVHVMDRGGYPVGRIRATVRTAGKIIGFYDAPGGIFQATIDRADFNMGVTIMFGATGYRPLNVPAAAVVCNHGTRDANGVVTSMSANACQPFTYYLDRLQAAPAPPAYGPPPQAPAYGYRRRPPMRRPARPKRARRAAPEVEEVQTEAPASQPAQAPSITAPMMTQETPTWVYVAGAGAAVLVLGMMAMKG